MSCINNATTLLLPTRLKYSCNFCSLWSDGLRDQKDHRDAALIWKHFHKDLPATKSNKIFVKLEESEAVSVLVRASFSSRKSVTACYGGKVYDFKHS